MGNGRFDAVFNRTDVGITRITGETDYETRRETKQASGILSDLYDILTIADQGTPPSRIVSETRPRLLG
jgi:hypothetical protein